MKSATAQSGGWTRGRWLLALLGTFALQVGLIFVLGERTSPHPRSIGPTQSLQLTIGRTELQELLDPTLFTRPHGRDFSVATWLRPTAPVFPVYRWNEPTRPLPMSLDHLGRALAGFLQTNVVASLSLGDRPAPELLGRQRNEILEALPARSTLTIAGDLATRALLNAPALSSWPADDLLTNTIVRVEVDDSGRVFTAVLLGAERVSGGSGSLAADQAALEAALKLRFAPVDNGNWLSSPAARLTRGVLVFRWRSVPLTNGVTSPVKSP